MAIPTFQLRNRILSTFPKPPIEMVNVPPPHAQPFRPLYTVSSFLSCWLANRPKTSYSRTSSKLTTSPVHIKPCRISDWFKMHDLIMFFRRFSAQGAEVCIQLQLKAVPLQIALFSQVRICCQQVWAALAKLLAVYENRLHALFSRGGTGKQLFAKAVYKVLRLSTPSTSDCNTPAVLVNNPFNILSLSTSSSSLFDHLCFLSP